MQPVIIKSYLKKLGDENHKLELTDQAFRVTRADTCDPYEIEDIKHISIVRKKLIIPLVLGGIGTSLSMLALSVGWYHYQLNLMAVFLFFAWMYYGFVGKDAIEILVKDQRHIYLISGNSELIKTFINFMMEKQWKTRLLKPALIYHIVEATSWNRQSTSYEYSHSSLQKEGFIHASTSEQLSETIQLYCAPNISYYVLAIETSWVLSPIQWENAPSRGSSFPHIYGPINKSAIINVSLLEN